jgi:hypothetical protein
VKILTTLLTGAVLFVIILSLPSSAQNNLADPNDSACWQSVEALHNCAQVQNDRAIAQAERCTSYPEYQCEAEPDQPQQTASVARVHKQHSKAASASAVKSHPAQGSNSDSDAVLVGNPAN